MLRIAGVQFRGSVDKEWNIQRATELIREAAAQGASMVCLPEIFNTMYFCSEENQEYFKLAEPVPGPTTQRMSELTKMLGIALVCPIFEATTEGKFFNTAVLLGPQGEELGRYRKMSIPYIRRTLGGKEKYYFTPGDLGFPVFKTPFGVNVGILICYDRHFPEAARALGLNGADIVFIPNATWEVSRHAWEIEVKAHAIANHYYVCSVNKVDKDQGGSERIHTGASLIVNPRGETLAQASADKDEIILGDIDKNLSLEMRELWKFFENRRPDAYGILVH